MSSKTNLVHDDKVCDNPWIKIPEEKRKGYTTKTNHYLKVTYILKRAYKQKNFTFLFSKYYADIQVCLLYYDTSSINYMKRLPDEVTYGEIFSINLNKEQYEKTYKFNPSKIENYNVDIYQDTSEYVDTQEGKFVSPESPPEGLERELLTVLAEECAEVQQRIFKILRFGLTEVQPGQEYDNSQRLAHEVGDTYATVERLINHIVLNVDDIEEGKRVKHLKLDEFLQNQGDN